MYCQFLPLTYVEVKKNHKVAPRPKSTQRSKIQEFFFFFWIFNKEKKRRKGPNPLRVHKEGPKSMNGQVLDLIKQRKEKAQSSPQRSKKSLGSLGENWARIPGDSQEPRILGTGNKAKLGLGLFKGACQETQGTRIDKSLSATQ